MSDERDAVDLHALRLIVRDLVWWAMQKTESSEEKEIFGNHYQVLNEMIEEDDFEEPHKP